jgi:hypothetical protein
MDIKNKLNTLNGWQRIGVILSVLWFFGAGLQSNSSFVNQAYQNTSVSYELCNAATHDEQNQDKAFEKLEQCSKDRDKKFEMNLEGMWLRALIVAALPIPIIWYLITRLIKLYKWTSAGFQKDTRKKK